MAADTGLAAVKPWSIPRTSPAAAAWHNFLLSVPHSPALMLIVLALGVICLRLPFIDHSVLSADEAVYLMIGAGIRDGLIPYVDIVDRKPIGIFLVYGSADLLFNDAIVGVRIIGAMSTLLASWMLARIGNRFLGLEPVAATLCGLFYATYALLFYGDSGQTPVYYMPFVIAGAGLVLRELRRLALGKTPSAWRLGIAGLALGISLQIKYSTFFECVMFGGLFLYTAWQYRALHAQNARSIAFKGAAAMIIGGLLPTALVWAVYAAIGHNDAFVFYNFTVNLTRQATDFPGTLILFRAMLFTLAMLPLAVLGGKYVWSRVQPSAQVSPFARQRWVHNALLLWFAAALFGALAQKQPYATYFFDVLAPLALLAAAGLQSRVNAPRPARCIARAAGIVLLLGISGYIGLHMQKIADNGSPYLPQTIAADIRNEDAKSMYVFNYYGIMYPLTGLSIPTRYPLPDHLLRNLEAASFQFDPIAELRRVLDGNPDVIVVRTPFAARIPTDRREMLQKKLTQDYCLIRNYQAGPQRIHVYGFRGGSLRSAVSTTCTTPIQLNEWVTASKH